MSVEWQQLASDLGSLTPTGESSGTKLAQRAISAIMGDDELVEAVRHYVARRPGAELARSVLWLLRPRAAMDECYRLFREADDLATRRAAVELLRVVGDETTASWVREFLIDSDEMIQAWGIGLIDQLVWHELVVESDVASVLDLASRHSNPKVSERAAFIRNVLASRGTEL